MNVLGIETSCDETSAALVKDGRTLLSNIVFSQEDLHGAFGGIVPEIASRAHLERINAALELALRKHGDFEAVAVTAGPGLIGSLLVGKMAAQALAWTREKPLVAVNHLEAHLFANLLEHKELSPPFLGLIVSGGHTDLVLVRDFGLYQLIGRTRDDAAGECFDKVAKSLGLKYPGGPEIDRLAAKGDPGAICFPHPRLRGSWDFSFSGLKTAVIYYLKGLKGRRNIPDICASFQAAVVGVLAAKTVEAARRFGMKNISVGGGVAANSELRARLAQEAGKAGLKIYLPSKGLCTDNAAMVAALAFHKIRRLKSKAARDLDVQVDPSLPIRNWS